MSPNDELPTARLEDPAGIRARIPDLESFAHDPAIRRAIESGSSHKVYRALLWAHLTGRTGPQSAVAARLLADRRLFLEPLRGTPAMYTFNSVGTMLHGRSEQRPDGSYIATLFLVALFLPVVPLGSYLVESAGGRAYRFYGRVPMSAVTLAWQGLAGLGAASALLLGASAMWWAGSHATLHVVNALPIPVVASVDGREITVPPDAHGELTLDLGAHVISIRDTSGSPIQEESFQTYAGNRVAFFNVLGAAPLAREEVVYATSGTPPTPEPEVACGQSIVRWSSVDYAFVEPPATMSMSRHTTTTTRTHVDVIDGGWPLCLGVLASRNGLADAIALLNRIAAVLDHPIETLSMMMALDDGTATSELLAFADRVRTAHPEMVDAHRIYQSLAIADGRRAAVRADYEARLAADPTSADLAYLVARTIPGDEGMRAMQAVLERFPDNVFAHRALAYQLYSEGRWAESLAEWDTSDTLAGGPTFVEPRIACLVRLDRAPEALERIQQTVATSESIGEQSALAQIYATIARSTTGVDPGAALASCEFAVPSSRVVAQLDALLPIAPGDEELLDGEDRQRAHVLLAAPTDPYRALVLAESLPPRAVHSMSPEVATLLFAEAARTDPASPAATHLRAGTTLGQATLDDIARYVTTGELSVEVEELDLPVRAVVWFVRSRAERDAAARDALIERARHDDVFSGWATAAIAGWPAP